MRIYNIYVWNDSYKGDSESINKDTNGCCVHWVEKDVPKTSPKMCKSKYVPLIHCHWSMHVWSSHQSTCRLLLIIIIFSRGILTKCIHSMLIHRFFRWVHKTLVIDINIIESEGIRISFSHTWSNILLYVPEWSKSSACKRYIMHI